MEKRHSPQKKVVTYTQQHKLAERNTHFRKKTNNVLLSLVNRVLLCTNEIDVDASVALARALSMSGITHNNYLAALRFLESNNSHVVNALVGRRKPGLLFRSVKPNWFLVKETFRILAQFSRETLLDKALAALLGIIQGAYKTSRFGYSVYAMTISDIYSIGKYLDKGQVQDAPSNRMILDLLFDIYQLGVSGDDEKMKSVAISANLIRMAFFDETKRMTDVIPHVLLLDDTQVDEVSTRYIAEGEDE